MLINLTEVLSREDKVVKATVQPETTSFDVSLGTFPLTDWEPLTLTITNLGKEKLLLSGATQVVAHIPCDRCLADVPTPIELVIDREVDMKQTEEDRIEDLDETEFIIGYNLDVEKLLRNEILVNWPMKTLCSETCKGICRKCGTNLNHSTCGCDTVELDPRMAVIAEIFKNSN